MGQTYTEFVKLSWVLSGKEYSGHGFSLSYGINCKTTTLFSPRSLFHIIYTFAVYGVFSACCMLLVTSKTGSTQLPVAPVIWLLEPCRKHWAAASCDCMCLHCPPCSSIVDHPFSTMTRYCRITEWLRRAGTYGDRPVHLCALSRVIKTRLYWATSKWVYPGGATAFPGNLVQYLTTLTGTKVSYV